MIGPYDLPDEPATTPTGLPAGPDVTQPIELVPDDNLLVTAAKLLRQRGRCTRRLIDTDDRICPVCAIAEASGIDLASIRTLQTELDESLGPVASNLPPIYATVNALPETAHLAATIRASGSVWATRNSPPVSTLWYWADRVDDDEVLRLLDAAADTFEAVPA